MFKIRLSFVPPGGGEADYNLLVSLPALPREGDYISVRRDPMPEDRDYLGTEDFIVRRIWWNIVYPNDGDTSHAIEAEPVGEAEIWAECEFAIGPFSSVAHKRGAEGKAKHPAKHFEASNY
jgi:hypothetical protein